MEKREASSLYEKIFLNTDTEMNFMSYFEYGKMIELCSKNFNIYNPQGYSMNKHCLRMYQEIFDVILLHIFIVKKNATWH